MKIKLPLKLRSFFSIEQIFLSVGGSHITSESCASDLYGFECSGNIYLTLNWGMSASLCSVKLSHNREPFT